MSLKNYGPDFEFLKDGRLKFQTMLVRGICNISAADGYVMLKQGSFEFDHSFQPPLVLNTCKHRQLHVRKDLYFKFVFSNNSCAAPWNYRNNERISNHFSARTGIE